MRGGSPASGPAVRYLYPKTYGGPLARLNPAQHRLLERHVERAVEALEEADRLLHGLVASEVARAVAAVEEAFKSIDHEEVPMRRFAFDELPVHLVSFLENPFAQSLAFNAYCDAHELSHTRGMKAWDGGNGAVTARNLLFLPRQFGELWEDGLLDKTRLISIANRNLTDEAYVELAELVRTRRKEDVDDRLLKLPPTYLRVGRRGPEQAMEAAKKHGWIDAFETVEIAEELVEEATDEGPREETPAEQALRTLRAGLSGATVAEEVLEALERSPDPHTLVERFLTAHRQSDDPDPERLTKTLFFAHAGPMQKLEADDKFLLRHFRPVKTQKRGQLFYRLLEVIEEALLEKSHMAQLDARGIAEKEAIDAVRKELHDLNKDPNRYLVLPEAWLGEVTRRHLYFGSRTRKEGAAYKWFRKIGTTFFLGSHKTQEEVDEKEARRAAKAQAQ